MIKHAMYKGVCAKYGTDRKKKCEEWWREISMNSLFCIKGVCFKYHGRFFVYWINRKKLEPISTQFASGKNAWIFLKKIIFFSAELSKMLYTKYQHIAFRKRRTHAKLYTSNMFGVKDMCSKLGVLEIKICNIQLWSDNHAQYPKHYHRNFSY